MNNYEFCAHWVEEQQFEKNARILDYGCGGGTIVTELRRRELNAFGCDVFYEGGDYSIDIDSEYFDSEIIKRIEGDVIPFDDASFDIVINNQVMEHVENLDSVLSEIQRVVKPGGVVLSLFPDKGVWREGHCGVAFLHWFPKHSGPRVYYAAMVRALGFGYHKGEKSVMTWSRDFCEWIDNWTHYRTREEIDLTYNKHFVSVEHIEDYWLQSRFGESRKARVSWLPASVQRVVVQKLAGMVFVAYKST